MMNPAWLARLRRMLEARFDSLDAYLQSLLAKRRGARADDDASHRPNGARPQDGE